MIRFRIMALGFSKNQILAMGFGALVFFAQSSACLAAGNIETLTKKNVKAFIEDTTDITTTNTQALSPEKIQAYLDTHLDKKARFKSVMKYNMPGMPPQEAALSLDKEEFMKSVVQGAETVDDYDTLVEIKNIKIASDGKKAFVKTQNTEYATMPVPTETGDVENVPMEGVSECTQILLLKRGVIKMYDANCVTNIEFLEY